MIHDAVQTAKGGWMSLANYCATVGPKGNGVRLASECVTMDEELIALELGERVINEMLAPCIDGFDALMDAIYAEYCKREGG